MTSSALQYAAQALYLVMILSLPPIIAASVVGILIAFIQAVTQLQEQTLTYGVKLVTVIGVLFLISSWLGSELLRFSNDIFSHFYLY